MVTLKYPMTGKYPPQEGDRKVAAEYMTAPELEELTGTRASTWRYWASIGQGPASFKLGRRRVWARRSVLAWLEAQEAKV